MQYSVSDLAQYFLSYQQFRKNDKFFATPFTCHTDQCSFMSYFLCVYYLTCMLERVPLSKDVKSPKREKFSFENFWNLKSDLQNLASKPSRSFGNCAVFPVHFGDIIKNRYESAQNVCKISLLRTALKEPLCSVIN